MNFENCPTWICDEQGIPFDIFYFITFVILLIPFLGLVFTFFDKKKSPHLPITSTPLFQVPYLDSTFILLHYFYYFLIPQIAY